MQCTRVAKSGVLKMDNLSSRPGDCSRYPTEDDRIAIHTMNPYQPPGSFLSERVLDTSPRFLFSLVPATFVIGLALFVWVLLVSMFDRLIPSRLSMPFWSFSLFLSSSLSMFAVVRVWRTVTHPLAFLAAFTVFGIVFVIAEGDTSKGTDFWHALILYGTLAALPVAMFLLARYLVLKIGPASGIQLDGSPGTPPIAPASDG